MIKVNLILLSILCFLAASCEKREVVKKGDFENVSQGDIKFDLVFPEELWNQILRDAPLTINVSKSPYDLFESLFVQTEIVDSPKQVLNGTNYRFDFKEFGGEIDFNNYLNRSRVGSFRMFFNFPALDEGTFKVYFLSWSKQYSVDEEVFGNGCGYFYNVTSYFKKEVLRNGLLLHTNNYRYLDLIAGRLYFVNFTKNKIQIAQVTLSDSSLEQRLCSDRI